ncbi:GNAT family N-acetyltransferase [Streptomyces griseoviridis]|uniref:N-acetyltransferase n=3 Tax=Streptomyces TaxID=1883 RepID=A0A918GP85_STRGD|nr:MULTISPECIES: GNAT family N-acetyltransferase [Streptomyces]MDP9686062.1 GNAT superfamily N-acetyltransferase [Streptomyces griseoviridis]GGS46658.1 N-acetyltransferase [Streptomyces niveoruber]GGS79117.1 N-acetyltransferase [Streptomyces griseoviridis]GGU16528.1 N-acetyltransferase [Streptomyces daghestanicus]GHI35349.1 N-acetyltransferase [Streptomyces daghestanicus]
MTEPPREPVRIRPLTGADWDAVVSLEHAAYAPLGLSEGRAALQSRAAASPGTCFVADVGGRPAGYLLALPYPALACPDLGRAGEPPGPPAGNLHLHDLVVAPGLRRRGLGRHLLRRLTGTARTRGDRRISLVAVGGSERYWSARGFTPHPDVTPSGGYGAGAVYMSRPVPDPHEAS